MNDTSTSSNGEIPVEAAWQEALAQGDAALSKAAPILGHLVLSPGDALFSDEIVAHVRGMATSIAAQFMGKAANAMHEEEPAEPIAAHQDAISAALLADDALLFHLHTLTIEWQLTNRLEQDCAFNAVLSPLLQALIESDDPSMSSTAMAVLAAQSRFLQQQRRMELPLHELPGDLFQSALEIWRGHMGGDHTDAISRAEEALRAEYDESRTRIGLLARLISKMGSGAYAALSLGHAGVAMFITALAFSSHQDRDLTAFATTEGQMARLALALRAAGIKKDHAEEQFAIIHPDATLPEGFDMLQADRAAALLGTAANRAKS